MYEDIDERYIDNIINADDSDIPQPSGRNDIYNIPTSVTIHMMNRTLIAGRDSIDKLPQRNDHYTVLSHKINPYTRLVRYESRNADIYIRIEDINKLSGSNKGIIKLLAFFMYQFNKQCVEYRNIKSYSFEFSLKLLVDAGIYSSTQSARRAIYQSIGALQSYKLVSEYIKYGESIDADDKDFDSIVLFTRIKVEDGKCKVTLNDEAGTDFYIKYFTILPAYCFSLPIIPFITLYYIFYKARMSDTLAKFGYFDIKLKELWKFLMLPTEHETKSIKDKTLDPILKSVEEIKQKHNEYYNKNNDEFNINVKYDGKDAPKTIKMLNEGYLRVTLSGKFLEPFENIDKRKTLKIEQVKQKHKKSINDKSTTSCD